MTASNMISSSLLVLCWGVVPIVLGRTEEYLDENDDFSKGHMKNIRPSADQESDSTIFGAEPFGQQQSEGNYFMDVYSVQTGPKEFEFGHVFEDPNLWEQRYEKKDEGNKRFQGQARWADKDGGYGEHYWDYNHGGDAHEEGTAHEDVVNLQNNMEEPITDPRIQFEASEPQEEENRIYHPRVYERIKKPKEEEIPKQRTLKNDKQRTQIKTVENQTSVVQEPAKGAIQLDDGIKFYRVPKRSSTYKQKGEYRPPTQEQFNQFPNYGQNNMFYEQDRPAPFNNGQQETVNAAVPNYKSIGSLKSFPNVNFEN